METGRQRTDCRLATALKLSNSKQVNLTKDIGSNIESTRNLGSGIQRIPVVDRVAFCDEMPDGHKHAAPQLDAKGGGATGKGEKQNKVPKGAIPLEVGAQTVEEDEEADLDDVDAGDVAHGRDAKGQQSLGTVVDEGRPGLLCTAADGHHGVQVLDRYLCCRRAHAQDENGNQREVVVEEQLSKDGKADIDSKAVGDKAEGEPGPYEPLEHGNRYQRLGELSW